MSSTTPDESRRSKTPQRPRTETSPARRKLQAYPRRVVAEGDPDAADLARWLEGLDLDALKRRRKTTPPKSRATFLRRKRRERHTTHYWIEREVDGVARRYFVKRYRPPVQRNFATFALKSRVEREYSNSRLAMARGLPVVQAIAFVERRRWGVVVDQAIVFHDIGRCYSATRLVRIAKRMGDASALQAEILNRLAHDLKEMHERGYSHLSVSPRNYLRLDADDRFFVIDHNAAVAFPRSIHATRHAIPDLMNLFESRNWFPDRAARAQFLQRYAPENHGFRGRMERLDPSGWVVRTRRRLQKIERFLAPACSGTTPATLVESTIHRAPDEPTHPS